MPSKKPLIKLPGAWTSVATVGSALGIGNFQNDYLPRLVKWGDYFLNIFDVLDRITKFFLWPIEVALGWIFRWPDFSFPDGLASYYFLTFILFGGLYRAFLFMFVQKPEQRKNFGCSLVALAIFVFAPGLWFAGLSGFMMYTDPEYRRKFGPWAFFVYGLFSLACIPIMITDWHGLGRIIGIASIGSLYLMILAFVLFGRIKKIGKIEDEDEDEDETLSLFATFFAGPLLFIILAFTFSDFSK